MGRTESWLGTKKCGISNDFWHSKIEGFFFHIIRIRLEIVSLYGIVLFLMISTFKNQVEMKSVMEWSLKMPIKLWQIIGELPFFEKKTKKRQYSLVQIILSILLRILESHINYCLRFLFQVRRQKTRIFCCWYRIHGSCNISSNIFD